MRKSVSCFKLITCSSDAADDNDDYQVSEIKDSSDKRGWSFRKKSARHHVVSNAVMINTPSSANKEGSECNSNNFHLSTETNIAEKCHTTNCSDEKPPLSSVPNSQLSKTVVSETESKVDVNPPECVVITIQAAIRRFMAQGALLKLKNVVKLQAAARGHIVRRHAVGTLHCLQATVKLQLLVRARHARLLHQDKHGKNNGSEILGNGNHVSKSSVKSTSIEKLLSNRFAHQLLKSVSKSKPILVKCDPSKADSAWKWLERWTYVSSLGSAESKTASPMVEQSDNNKSSTSLSQLETGLQSEVFCRSDDLKLTVEDSAVPSEVDEKVTTHDTGNLRFEATHCTFHDAGNLSFEATHSTSHDAGNLSFEATHSTSVAKNDLEHAQPEMTFRSDAKVTSEEIISQLSKTVTSDAIAPQELSSLPEKPEIGNELPKRSMKRFAFEQLETEGTKFGYGSRKGSNPSFIAAQSKFEELSTMANSDRSSSLSNKDATVEAHGDPISVGTDSASRSKELFFENSASFPSRIGGSECGTELSISSTLDSPDISEIGATENEPEAKDSSDGICNPDKDSSEGICNPDYVNHEVESNVFCNTPACGLPSSAVDQPGTANDEDINSKSVHSAVVVDSKEPALKPEKNMSDLQREQAESAVQDLRASPEASPRSHVTVPESQRTPSSQVSVKPEERKSEKTGSGSTNRQRLLSAGNKSPANATSDSGSRGSREQLPKDQRSGKRRNSFGSAKLDHIDQESRDNSNNSSLPHFMQATESARAKINANNSPRSSPDLHDHEVKVKRHSLPGASATGRQVSPHIRRSISQSQEGTKGQGLQPPHERKWQR